MLVVAAVNFVLNGLKLKKVGLRKVRKVLLKDVVSIVDTGH